MPNGFVKDDAMLCAAAGAGGSQVRGLRRPADEQFLMEVDAISLKDRDSGNLFWGRNVGTAGHDDTQAWVESYFKKHNLQNVHRLPFDLAPQWTPKSCELTFTGGGKPLALKSARPATRMASTPPEGLEWDLVWSGGGTAADFLGT